MSKPNMVVQNAPKKPADHYRGFREKSSADEYENEMKSAGHKTKRTMYKIGPRKKPIQMHNVHVWYKKDEVQEDAAVNNAGAGAIAGIGVGPDGEPGVHLKKKRRVVMSDLIKRWMQGR